MTKDSKQYTPEEKALLNKVFWRTMTLSSSYNYERMQGLGYLYTMIPVINEYYENEEDRREAYIRHFNIFNTTPTVGGFITGLTTSMEKEAALDPEFDKTAIDAVKVSLMGPLAGIGDSIFWGSLRIISLGIGISLCAAGNPIGILLHLLIFNIPATLVRFYGVRIGYNMGSSFLQTASETGVLSKITKAAQIVGLMTVGAMTVTMVKVPIGLVLNFSGTELIIQDVLDQILPSLLPILYTFGCFKAIDKGVKPVYLIIISLVLAVVGKVIGLF